LNASGVTSIKSADASLVTHTHLVQTELDLVLLPRLPMLRSQLQNDRLVLNAMAAGIPCLSSPSATFNPSPLIQPPLEAAAWIEALEALLSTASARADYRQALARWGLAHYGNTEGRHAAVSAYLN
ncbi:MAG: glycosyltransferase, partial [Burkholderiaceae bacterium]